jgi:signal transduction histidine kinase
MSRHPSVPGTWSLTPLLAAFGMIAALIAGTEIVMILEGPVRFAWIHVVTVLLGLTYCLAGLVAWSRRPSNRTCALLTFTGLAWFGAALAAVDTPALIAVGEVVAVLPVALTLQLLFAFPSGVVSGRADRIAVAAAYVAALVLQMPAYLFRAHEAPYDVLLIADRPGLAHLGLALQVLVGWAVVIVAIGSLRRRLRRAGPRQRRALRPFAVYAILAVLVIPVVGNLLPLVVGIGSHTILGLQRIVLAGIPVAAVATMLRGGFARIGAIEELGAWLGTGEQADLREALARTLGDPGLTLGFRLEDGALVDGDGRPWSAPPPGAGRHLHEVRADGRPVATISFDPTLVGDVEDVAAAGRLLLLWVERERLTAALWAGEAELRRSRARVIEAADDERQRIARDLHDGLASRLLLLAVRADQMLADADRAAPARRRELATLRDELESSIGELRALVQGMMPAALLERGLPEAIDDLVDRVPILTRVECRGVGTLPTELARTAYFVVAEALANAVKHARARTVALRVVGEDGTLTIAVADDGVGGAREGLGVGLRAMAARVEASGGRLEATSPAGGGTRIVATLPLEAATAAGTAAGNAAATPAEADTSSARQGVT